VKIFLDIAKESSDWLPPLKSALGGMNALIKQYEVLVRWMTAAHNLHERPQHFQDVREKIKDLTPVLERFKQSITTATIDGDQAETQRRTELSRCARRLLDAPILTKVLYSALEYIKNQSRELLAKGPAVRFLDKGADSGEVVKLVERLREAITQYQVSGN